MMITISYKNSVFRITDISLILEKLYYYLNQQKNIKESSLAISKIVIDPIVFKFVIIDLLKEKKGIKTFCKFCDLLYCPDQITIEKMGTYPETQSTKEERNIWKWIKRFFEIGEPETRKIGRFGGEKLICPKGHELLSVVRWIS